MNLDKLTQAVADQLALIPAVGSTFNYPVRSAEPVFATVAPQEFPVRLVYGTPSPRVPLTVRVVVGRVEEATAARLLYDLMGTGTNSVVTRLEAIDSAEIDSLAVDTVGEPQVFDFGGVFLLGVDFTVDVIAAT